MNTTRRLLRVVDPQFPRNNIYRFQARRTISLGPVMIATVADEQLPWLEAEVITENNYRSGLAAPHDKEGNPDHLALQRERRAEVVCVSASITPAVPRALEIIRTRVDQFGVSEPLIQKAGDERIIVELAGIVDTSRARSLVEQSAYLEF